MQLEEDLGIEPFIQNLSGELLLEADTFSVIDKKIIVSLKDFVLNVALANSIVQEWIEKL
ncbi:MAG TPA: hypothetical protein DEH15_19315 [Marinilabiliales bacterium]|nr:hypothetical protein [Marinilabiliales bacterium]